MRRAADDGLQAARDALPFCAEVDQEMLAGVARQLDAAAAGQQKVEQLANLGDVGLTADPLGRALVALEEDGVAPVDDLEAPGLAIPEEVPGVHVVVNDVALMRRLQQIEQAIHDDQQLQLR